MLGLFLIFQGHAIIAFFFGVFNASKGLKMLSEDEKSPQGYLMSIGGALAGFSATMFMPIRLIGIILWAVGSVCCCIGASWYDNTHEDKIYGQIIRIFTTIFVFVILTFFYNVLFLNN
jgi:hypothetical protein